MTETAGTHDGTAGFVLTGGGARAAYQVGAIRALARMTRPDRSPFPILVGMSAGALNAAALAAGADDFGAGARRLGRIWRALTPDQVYRTDSRRLAVIGARWIRDLTASGLFGENTINFLLDTAPLRRLLASALPLERLPAHIGSGALRGLAISATDYATATGVTFFDGAPGVQPWVRSLRFGVRAKITLDHVMASAAIPLFFPPVRIGDAFFGDGCIRMLAPVSPAIHLGADRVIAIGVRHKPSPSETVTRQLVSARVTLPIAEIIGTLLDALFLDSLELDAERLARINQMLGAIAPEHRTSQPVRTIPLLIRVDWIARRLEPALTLLNDDTVTARPPRSQRGSLRRVRPQRALDRVAQHHRAVVLLVTSAVDERHHAAGGALRELTEEGSRRVGPQLGVVSARELAKPIGLVSEPAAQGGAGREVLRPEIESQRLLLHAAGPQPIDEHAVAVVPRRLLVRTLDPDHPVNALRRRVIRGRA